MSPDCWDLRPLRRPGDRRTVADIIIVIVCLYSFDWRIAIPYWCDEKRLTLFQQKKVNNTALASLSGPFVQPTPPVS